MCLGKLLGSGSRRSLLYGRGAGLPVSVRNTCAWNASCLVGDRASHDAFARREKLRAGTWRECVAVQGIKGLCPCGPAVGASAKSSGGGIRRRGVEASGALT
jgi:hypothetical protein